MAQVNRQGEIQLDFHGLKVREAKQKVNELVVPVLPVVRSMVLITGRGRHSASGGSALKPAIEKVLDEPYETYE